MGDGKSAIIQRSARQSCVPLASCASGVALGLLAMLTAEVVSRPRQHARVFGHVWCGDVPVTRAGVPRDDERRSEHAAPVVPELENTMVPRQEEHKGRHGSSPDYAAPQLCLVSRSVSYVDNRA
jgi:hypothetical protein